MPKNTLTIGADGFSLPLDAVTQTFAILGIRGSGKTNTAVVLTEEMLKQSQQVVILDPTDVWWGLRGSAGHGSGFPVTIMGGEHGDLPLEASAGALIADFVVDQCASMVLSLRHMSMADQRRFAADFAERLYARKGEAKSRTPLHLVIDECDEFIPQRIPPGGERMFGAFDRIVRRGRAAGMGVTMISQRAQVVNKDVLSQIETLICHRVLHKLDRKALEAWIEAHDSEGQSEEFLASLASLGRGDTWIWSPEWLGLFKRIHIRARETFDSSATPKAGQPVNAPRRMTEVNLGQLREKMAATLEKAKADDPAELRRQIVALRQQLASAHKAAPALDHSAIAERLKKAEERGALKTQAGLAKFTKTSLIEIGKAAAALEVAHETLRVLAKSTAGVGETLSTLADQRDLQIAQIAVSESRKFAAYVGSLNTAAAPVSGVKLAKAERAILSVLSQVRECPKNRLALIAGYSVDGGGFNNALSSLRSNGFVQGSDPIRVLDAGIEAVGPVAPLPTGRDLFAYWLRHESVGKAERAILDALSTFHGMLPKTELAARTGYAVDGGGFNNALSTLRTLGLIHGKTEIVLAEELR